MSDEREQGYEDGQRSVWRQLLREALRNLGDEENNAHAWRLERGEAIARLRSICAEHGDNDWDERLHLADIIEKHLGDHLG